MWYTVEDNPEITAALEEERASSLSRKTPPGAKRGEALLALTGDAARASVLIRKCRTERSPTKQKKGERPKPFAARAKL